jgi:hypothetical protein
MRPSCPDLIHVIVASTATSTRAMSAGPLDFLAESGIIPPAAVIRISVRDGAARQPPSKSRPRVGRRGYCGVGKPLRWRRRRGNKAALIDGHSEPNESDDG